MLSNLMTGGRQARLCLSMCFVLSRVGLSDCKGPENNKVVAAIDFGTRYSGYAYSFESNPDEIFAKAWPLDGTKNTTAKTPTTVLLYPNQTFHSFGYSAEDKYATLAKENKIGKWYYFTAFKLKLYSNRDLHRDSLLRDMDGKRMQAIKVFTCAIEYMKNMLLADVKAKRSAVKDDEVTWVITVPAIWSYAAKQFMREASVKAGINGDNLKLVLEPEAAALYCKTREPDDMKVISGNKTGKPMAPGKKFILLDLGGGIVDSSAYQVLPNGRNLREIHRATGDAVGGVAIDEQFIEVVKEIMGGEPIWTMFKQLHRADYLDFMKDVEAKKRMSITRSSKLSVTLPSTLLELLEHRFNSSLEKAVKGYPHAAHVKVSADKLLLDTTMIDLIYKKPVDAIVKNLKKMKLDERVHDVSTIILTGGIAKSTYVITAINESFPDYLIITPIDPGLAILKGAVLMGLDPDRIQERVARYTFGVSYARKPFHQDEDPEELKVERDGVTYCDGLFEKLVEIGQTVKRGKTFTVHHAGQLNRHDSKFKTLHTNVFASIETDPIYSTDKYYCVKIGEVTRLPPEKGWTGLVKSTVEIAFDGTEMTVVSREPKTGALQKAKLDSL